MQALGSKLFQRLRRQQGDDVHFVGRDLEDRPVLYVCSGRQVQHLKEWLGQLHVAVEAAHRLSRPGGDGRVTVVADMHGVQMATVDAAALAALADFVSDGLVDRLYRVLVVSFPLFGQALWAMAKPLMDGSAWGKLDFAREAAAREIVRRQLAQRAASRVLGLFDSRRNRWRRHQEAQERCAFS